MVGGTWLSNSPWASFGFAAVSAGFYAFFHWNGLGWEGAGVMLASLAIGITTSLRFQSLRWQEEFNHSFAPLTVVLVGVSLGFAPFNEVLGSLIGLAFLSHAQAFFRRSNATRDYFLAGVWASIAALISHQGVCWVILSAAAILFAAVITFRILAVWFAGLSLPIYLYAAFRFVSGNWEVIKQYWEGYADWLGPLAFQPVAQLSIQFWIGFLVLATLSILGLIAHGAKLLPRERPFIRNVGLLFASAVGLSFGVSYISFPVRLVMLLPFLVIGLASVVQALQTLAREFFIVMFFVFLAWILFRL